MNLKKTAIVLGAAVFMTLPTMAFAQMLGDCYDCHTMHNSEQDEPVAQVTNGLGSVTTSDAPLPNLLRLDCISCHGHDPVSGTKLWTMSGGSVVPQVIHGANMNNSLAGGNFRFTATNERMGHNVVDLFAGMAATGLNTEPPGISHSSSREVFTSPGSTDPFDMFTCAGARGCHGTRSQAIGGSTNDNDTDTTSDDVFAPIRRVAMAAVSGSHHALVTDGLKDDPGYTSASEHDGTVVAAGYRFIPGLYGWGNDVERWVNNTADHNEYYGEAVGFGTDADSTGCDACHIQGSGGTGNSRATYNSTIRTPNNSMSGFCSTCHGNFHSAGEKGTAADPNMDRTFNGISGAFLRHPSDYQIPASGEYNAYTTWDPTAPVARPDVTQLESYNKTQVVPGRDMVMCLSCHYAHGSQRDYMLRFNYNVMTSGAYADQATAQSMGGCLACHSLKGVQPTP